MEHLLDIYANFYSNEIIDHGIFLALNFIIILDICMGHVSAVINGVFDTRKSKEGLMTHSILIIVVGLVYPVKSFYQIGYFVDGLMILYTINYFVSCLKHYYLMGGYVPKGVIEYLERFLSRDIDRFFKK